MDPTINQNPLLIANETMVRCNEIRQIIEDMRREKQARTEEVEEMRMEMRELMTAMREMVRGNITSQTPLNPLPNPPPMPDSKTPYDNYKLKLIK